MVFFYFKLVILCFDKLQFELVILNSVKLFLALIEHQGTKNIIKNPYYRMFKTGVLTKPELLKVFCIEIYIDRFFQPIIRLRSKPREALYIPRTKQYLHLLLNGNGKGPTGKQKDYETNQLVSNPVLISFHRRGY